MSAARAIVLDGRSFEEHELACPDCAAPMRLFYSRRFVRPWYACGNWPVCRGSHGARPDGRPMGTPADAATRKARREAHQAFDPIWEQGYLSRDSAYRWLAARMGLAPERAHVSLFSEADCGRVVVICLRLRRFLRGRA